MSLLWVTAAHDSLRWAKAWADEYPMSPVAHPEVVDTIRKFPPIEGPHQTAAQAHDLYSRLMSNVAHHHAQEWFRAGDADEFHEPTHYMTQHYLDAHNGTSEIEHLL